MADAKEKEKVIISILSLHPKDGADIYTIRREYKEMEGKELENSKEEATALMFRISNVHIHNGRFFSQSRDSEHISKLVNEQRPKPHMQRRNSCYFDRDRGSDDESHTRSSMNWAGARSRSPTRASRGFNGNSRSRSIVRPSAVNGFGNQSFGGRNRGASPPPTRTNSRPLNDPQSLHGFPTRDPRINNTFDWQNGKLDETMPKQTTAAQSDVQFQRFAIIGDDFFYSYMLERELFSRVENNFENVLEPKWSYCVVGQTIADAIVLIRTKNLENEAKEVPAEPVRAIVNIGAADVCRGTSFRQMVENFMELMETCAKFNIEPTITTLMPFRATENGDELAWKTSKFNEFLVENFSNVINLWSCFGIGLGRTLAMQFQLNGVATRIAGRDTDITWSLEDEEMCLEHRGKV